MYAKYNDIMKQAEGNKYTDDNLTEEVVVYYSSFKDMKDLAGELMVEVEQLNMQALRNARIMIGLNMEVKSLKATVRALQSSNTIF